MFTNDLFFQIETCGIGLCGCMGEEAAREFFKRNYTDPIPPEWKKMLMEEPRLLSPQTELYRTFWYCGLRDEDEMAEMVIKLLYLSYHAGRLPNARRDHTTFSL